MTIVLEGELEARVREVAAIRGMEPEALVMKAVDETARTDGMQRLLWNGMTVGDWIRASRLWIHKHEPWPELPDEALTREAIYDGHA